MACNSRSMLGSVGADRSCAGVLSWEPGARLGGQLVVSLPSDQCWELHFHSTGHTCRVPCQAPHPSPCKPPQPALPSWLPGWAAGVTPSPSKRRQMMEKAGGGCPGASEGVEAGRLGQEGQVADPHSRTGAAVYVRGCTTSKQVHLRGPGSSGLRL